MTLVAISSVRKLSHFLIFKISLERLQNFNKSNSLPITRDAYAELDLNFDSTREHFAQLW